MFLRPPPRDLLLFPRPMLDAAYKCQALMMWRDCLQKSILQVNLFAVLRTMFMLSSSSSSSSSISKENVIFTHVR